MLIGTHLSKQEKNYQKKFNNLIEVQNRLKKRISDLTKELNMYKYGKKQPSDLSEHKIEFDLDYNTFGGKFNCKTTKERQCDCHCVYQEDDIVTQQQGGGKATSGRVRD